MLAVPSGWHRNVCSVLKEMSHCTYSVGTFGALMPTQVLRQVLIEQEPMLFSPFFKIHMGHPEAFLSQCDEGFL